MGIAVAAAIGAGYVARNLTAEQPAPIVVEAAPHEPAMELVDVLVISRDVEMGSEIDGALRWQAWPAESVGNTFVTRNEAPGALEELAGSVARVALYEGEPLKPEKLVDNDLGFMSSILPSGKRAVATQIAADTSAGGFILPNDYVDVIMTRRSPNATTTEGFITETILTNIRVLAIDQAVREDEEGRRVKVGETATLELSPKQAEIITVAQQMADRLTLSLRSVADADEAAADEARHLVSGIGRGNSVRLIRSGEVSEVGTRR